jgi:hypothetical protein
MRRHLQKCTALRTGVPHTRDIPVLDVAYTPMNHFQMIGAGGAAEVAPFNEDNREAALRSVPRGTGTKDAPADDRKVELGIRQLSQITFHEIG